MKKNAIVQAIEQTKSLQYFYSKYEQYAQSNTCDEVIKNILNELQSEIRRQIKSAYKDGFEAGQMLNTLREADYNSPQDYYNKNYEDESEN